MEVKQRDTARGGRRSLGLVASPGYFTPWAWQCHGDWTLPELSPTPFHPQALNSNLLPGNTASASQSIPEEGPLGLGPIQSPRPVAEPRLCPGCAPVVPRLCQACAGGLFPVRPVPARLPQELWGVLWCFPEAETVKTVIPCFLTLLPFAHTGGTFPLSSPPTSAVPGGLPGTWPLHSPRCSIPSLPLSSPTPGGLWGALAPPPPRLLLPPWPRHIGVQVTSGGDAHRGWGGLRIGGVWGGCS